MCPVDALVALTGHEAHIPLIGFWSLVAPSGADLSWSVFQSDIMSADWGFRGVKRAGIGSVLESEADKSSREDQTTKDKPLTLTSPAWREMNPAPSQSTRTDNEPKGLSILMSFTGWMIMRCVLERGSRFCGGLNL